MYRPHRINVRLGDAGKDWIKALRREHLATEADVIRAALAVATKHRDEVKKHLTAIEESR